MSDPLSFVTTHTINDGELDSIRDLSRTFTDLVKAADSGLVAFHFYMSEDGELQGLADLLPNHRQGPSSSVARSRSCATSPPPTHPLEHQPIVQPNEHPMTSIIDTEGPDALAIETQQLTRTYPGGVEAVQGIDFADAPGEVFGLPGPNGAGNSTTFDTLTTTIAPTSGRAHVAGFDVSTHPIAARQASAVVFQEPLVDRSLTGRRNLQVHARQTSAACRCSPQRGGDARCGQRHQSQLVAGFESITKEI